MKARMNFSGTLCQPISVENGVKQGDIPAPTLFSIFFFAVMLTHTFRNCSIGVYLCFQTTRKIFVLHQFNASTKMSQQVIRELLYADDADIEAHTEEDMQNIMNLFANTCKSFGLTISLRKTKVIFTPPPGQLHREPKILVDSRRLEVVDIFVYLESTLLRDGTLDAEILHHIKKATKSFACLEKWVWSDSNIMLNIKVRVYESCVLTALLYSSETWTTYGHHITPHPPKENTKIAVFCT